MTDVHAASEVALVDGAPGIVVAPAGRLQNVLRVTVADGRITGFDVMADVAGLAQVSLAVFPDPSGGLPGGTAVSDDETSFTSW